MNESKGIKNQEKQAVPTKAETDVYLRPAVDIFEDAAGITLTADLPGVSRERLNIEVEKDILVIEGQMSLEVPQGMEALHADLRANRYQRRFTLSGGLDTDKISAQMKDGVLTLSVPKRAELQPRKIQIAVS